MPFKLIYKRPEMHSPYTAVNSVKIELSDEANLDHMLEAYAEFLQACGYNISGNLVIEEEE